MGAADIGDRNGAVRERPELGVGDVQAVLVLGGDAHDFGELASVTSMGTPTLDDVQTAFKDTRNVRLVLNALEHMPVSTERSIACAGCPWWCEPRWRNWRWSNSATTARAVPGDQAAGLPKTIGRVRSEQPQTAGEKTHQAGESSSSEPDCPAGSRSVKSAYGVATRSATPTLDPLSAPQGFGACEKDGREVDGRISHTVRLKRTGDATTRLDAMRKLL